MSATKGISIIICCHNSATRLPETLQRLTKQNLSDPWEVIVVNNASTDNTAEVATGFVDRLPLRVIDEPQAGLTHARHRGLKESKFGYLGFIDDDNYVQEDWAVTVIEIFNADADVAACGGPISEICEVTPPPWFEKFKGNYTIWEPHNSAQTIDHPLCGAGLCIRKSAWEKLIADGFEPKLSDRKGKALSSGGDFELGYALLLAGWTLYYDPRLHIEHFIPRSRLNWQYLCSLNYGFGKQSVVLDSYAAKVKKIEAPRRKQEIFRCLKSLLRHFPNALRHREGDAGLLLWLSQKGRLEVLLGENTSPRE